MPFADLGSDEKLMLMAKAIEVQGTKMSSKQYWENRSIQVRNCIQFYIHIYLSTTMEIQRKKLKCLNK